MRYELVDPLHYRSEGELNASIGDSAFGYRVMGCLREC